MSYILPLFLTRFIGVFEMVWKTIVSNLCDKFEKKNDLEWLFHISVKFEVN